MQPKKFGFCFSFGRKNRVEGEGGGGFNQLETYISAANNNSSNGGGRGGGVEAGSGGGWGHSVIYLITLCDFLHLPPIKKIKK